MEFGWDTDPAAARVQVGERLALAREELPDNVVPSMGPVSSIMGEILLVGLVSPDGTVPGPELRRLADWTVRPAIRAIPGVSQVIGIGGGVEDLVIAVRPEALAARGVTLDQVRRAAASAQGSTTGGFLERQSQEYLVRNLARTADPEAIGNTVVAERDGVAIRLRDVARVEREVGVMRGDAGVNGDPGVVLSVQKQPGASTVALDHEIGRVLDELGPRLPPGVQIVPLFRQADFIEASMENVEGALRDGAILVAVVLVAVPPERADHVHHADRHPAVVRDRPAGPARVRALDQHDDPRRARGGDRASWWTTRSSTWRTSSGGCGRTDGPRTAAAPAVIVRGQRRRSATRSCSRPPSWCWCSSRCSRCSGVEGRLFAPLGRRLHHVDPGVAGGVAHRDPGAVQLPPAVRDGDAGARRRLAGPPAQGARSAAARPGPRPSGGGARRRRRVAVAIAVASVPFLGTSFLPPFNEGTATLNLLAMPGTSLAESNRLGTLAERLILQSPEVKSTGRRTGRAEQDEHAEGVHYTEIDVDFHEGGRPRDEVLAEIRSQLSQLAGVSVNVGQPISHRLDHLLSGVRAAIAVKLYGDDFGALRNAAGTVATRLAEVEGVVDLQVERQVLIPQVQIAVDRDKAAWFGVTPGALADDLETALGGTRVGQVLEGLRTLDVVVRYDRSARDDVDAIRNAPVALDDGRVVTLRQLADVTPGTGPNQILHEDGRRRIVISANTSGDRDGGKVRGGRRAGAGRDRAPRRDDLRDRRPVREPTVGDAADRAPVPAVARRDDRRPVRALPIGAAGPAGAGEHPPGADRLGGGAVAHRLGPVGGDAGGLRDPVRHRVAEHDPDDLALPAPDGPRGRAVRARDGDPRLARAAGPGRDDGAVRRDALVPLALAGGQPGKEILTPVAQVILGGLVSSTLLDMIVTPTMFLRFGRPIPPCTSNASVVETRDSTTEESVEHGGAASWDSSRPDRAR